MASKKIEEYSTPELQKMAKTQKMVLSIFIGMFTVYFGIILYLIYLGKPSTPSAVSFFALIAVFFPIYSTRSNVLAELKKRGEETV